MNFLSLMESGAVQSEQHGDLHVIRVKLEDYPVPVEFCDNDFSKAMLLAERGIHWKPMELELGSTTF